MSTDYKLLSFQGPSLFPSSGPDVTADVILMMGTEIVLETSIILINCHDK
jgi:hypothetical protein